MKTHPLPRKNGPTASFNPNANRPLRLPAPARWFIPLALLCLLPEVARSTNPPLPGDPPPYLNYWSFNDTNNWLSDFGSAPLSFTNVTASLLGNGSALVVDATNAAWIKYHVTESGGTTNITLNEGTLTFWFAPNWASTNQNGTGPGTWGRLVEVGSYTTNASYGWWSLYVDPPGSQQPPAKPEA
jgi:hypothetical protein